MKNSFLKYLLLYATLIIAIWWSWQILFPPKPAEPAMEAWVLDVGQGQSVLVREPSGKKLLYDGGPGDLVLSELGAVLPPWDRTIDLVILSHNHSDHVRGLISVLERFEVQEVWISGAIYTTGDYKAWIAELSRQGIVPRSVHAPLTQQFGDAVLKVHHPLDDMTGKEVEHQHDANVSVEISFGEQDLFLTGDLEEKNEEEMLAYCQPPSCSLEAEVLQVPHHGSAYGLLPAFLAAVAPELAVIPVGLDNRYQHPREIILERLQSGSVPVYRTDLQGRIYLTFMASGVSAQSERSGPP